MTATEDPQSSPWFDTLRTGSGWMLETAAKGLPALRAALQGARLGVELRAGLAAVPELLPGALEQLGLRIVPHSARSIASQWTQHDGTLALVVRRGNAVLKAGTQGLGWHSSEGLSLRISPFGSTVAELSQDALHGLARSSARSALRSFARATGQGALAGAVVEASISAVRGFRDVRAARKTPRQAALDTGRSAARGAFTGALSVAAAGLVSAGVAVTGISLLGAAPVALPLAALFAGSALAGRVFDHYLPDGESLEAQALPGTTSGS